jgi:hypothetical protein
MASVRARQSAAEAAEAAEAAAQRMRAEIAAKQLELKQRKQLQHQPKVGLYKLNPVAP